MMVKVSRSDCEGYTGDPATTENPECGCTAFLQFNPLWRMLNWDLVVTGRFKQSQHVTAAYSSFHPSVRKS